LNKLSEDFVSTENLHGSSTRPLSIALEQLIEQGVDVASVQQSIADVCAKSLIALQPYMLYEQELIFAAAGNGSGANAGAA